MGSFFLWFLLHCFWYWPALFWYPYWFWYPEFWGNRRNFFKFLKEELYNWKELLNVKMSFLFAVTLIFVIIIHIYHSHILYCKLSPKRNSESASAFFSNTWYWLSRKYAIWTHRFCSIRKVKYSHDWAVVVNLCNHDLYCAYIFTLGGSI